MTSTGLVLDCEHVHYQKRSVKDIHAGLGNDFWVNYSFNPVKPD